MHSANHNYFNTQWSPDSGQVAAGDDAHPGQCTTPGDSTYETQLTEAGQRRLGAAYIDAFFRRYLTDDKRFEAILGGKRHSLAHIAPVDVTATLADSARFLLPHTSRGRRNHATLRRLNERLLLDERRIGDEGGSP
ncbi:hypothetical protein [Streptomyces sp. NPDC001292]|uniref:hypothetical protein n=1 Tax=Streptomyces sp. NPDC001292 TaxID=3364558 RepID=UPI00369EE66E